MIHIRPNASKEIQRLLHKQANRRLLVHLDIAPGGCLEWTYRLTLTETFNQQKETAYAFSDFTIVLPNTASSYLQDLTIDYAEDLMGGGFRFINSQAQQICGCGNSFSVNAEAEPASSPDDCIPTNHQIRSHND